MRDENELTRIKEVFKTGVFYGCLFFPYYICIGALSGLDSFSVGLSAIFAAIFLVVFAQSRLEPLGPSITTALLAFLFIGSDQPSSALLLIEVFFVAGIIQIVLTQFSIDKLLRHIPLQSLHGFFAGFALVSVIVISPMLLGYPEFLPPNEFIDKISQFLDSATTDALVLSGSSILILLGTSYFFADSLVPFSVLLGSSVLQQAMNFDVPVLGDLPREVSRLSLPTLHIDNIYVIVIPAAILALLGLIDSFHTLISEEKRHGILFNKNQLMKIQGIANTFSSVFGGLPATYISLGKRDYFQSKLSFLLMICILIGGYILIDRLMANVPLPVFAGTVVFYAISTIRFERSKIELIINKVERSQVMKSCEKIIADDRNMLSQNGSVNAINRASTHTIEASLMFDFGEKAKELIESLTIRDTLVIDIQNSSTYDSSNYYALEGVIKALEAKGIDVWFSNDSEPLQKLDDLRKLENFA